MSHLFSKVISIENLFKAYDEFKKGKRYRPEVAEFELNLEANIFQLHNELRLQRYNHSPYFHFKISDPKPRIIHKAMVRDQVVHQAIYRQILSIFDASFIFDSYSSRKEKGTHRAIKKLYILTRQSSRNFRRPCWSIKLDIRRFFNNIDQKILLRLIQEKIRCPKTILLIEKIIKSYSTAPDKGLPLGNVTSQIFANIYLNPLDQFIKHQLRVKNYLRFCDDLIFVQSYPDFEALYGNIQNFLKQELHLTIKTGIFKVRKLVWGFDYLGYVILPHHTVLRTITKRRIFKKLAEKKTSSSESDIEKTKFNQALQSYLGLLKHCHGYKLKKKIIDEYS